MNRLIFLFALLSLTMQFVVCYGATESIKRVSANQELKRQISKEEKRNTTHLDISQGLISWEHIKFLNSITSLNTLGFELDNIHRVDRNNFKVGYNTKLDKSLNNIKTLVYTTKDFNTLGFLYWRDWSKIIPSLVVFPNIESVRIVCMGAYPENVMYMPEVLVPDGISPEEWQVILYPQKGIVEINRIVDSKNKVPVNSWVYGTFKETGMAQPTLDDRMAELMVGKQTAKSLSNLTIPSNICYIGSNTFKVNNPYSQSSITFQSLSIPAPFGGSLSTEKCQSQLYIDSDAFIDFFSEGTTHTLTFNRPVVIMSNAFKNFGRSTFDIICNNATGFGSNAFNPYVKNLELKDSENILRPQAFEFVENTIITAPQKSIANISKDYTPSMFTNELTKQKYNNNLKVPESQIDDFVKAGFNPELSDNYLSNLSSRIIEVKEPGTLLSIISPNELKKVSDLTIIGTVDDNDIKVLTELGKNLIKLNLSLAYTQLSSATREEREQNAAALRSLFGLMGLIAETRYNDFNMSSLDYATVKSFTSLVEEAKSQTKSSDKNCIIPKDALEKMPKLRELSLPIWCSEIESGAISGCSNLEKVVLPPYLIRIEAQSLSYCPKLKNIEFPSTLKFISAGYGAGSYHSGGAFLDCVSLKNVDLSKCVWWKENWDKMFYGCNIEILKLPQGIETAVCSAKEIYLPKGLKYLSVGSGTTIYCIDATPPSNYPTGPTIRNCTFYVPKGSITAYYAKFGKNNKIIEY